jgi:hypothetical protein
MWRPGLTPEEARYVARIRRLLIEDARSVVAPVPADCAGEWVIELEERVRSSSEALVCNVELDLRVASANFGGALERATSAAGIETALPQASTAPVVVLLRCGRISIPDLERAVAGASQCLMAWRAALDSGGGVRVLLEVTTSDRIGRTLPEPLETVEYASVIVDALEPDVVEEMERVVRLSEPAAIEFSALRMLDLSGDRPGDLGTLVSAFAELDAIAQKRLLAEGWLSSGCAPAVERRRAELADLLSDALFDPLSLTKPQIAALSSVGGLCELDGCPFPTPRTFAALGSAHGHAARDRVAERALVACFQLERRLRAVIDRERSTTRGAARLAAVLDSPWNSRTGATVRDEIRKRTPPELVAEGEVEVATFGQLLRIAEGIVQIPAELYRDLHAAVRLRNELAHQRGVDLSTFSWLRATEARAKREIGALRSTGRA